MYDKEQQVQIQPDSTGKGVRTIEVVAFIQGVPTTVQMQVMSIADAAGNIIDNFVDYNWQRKVIEELMAIREQLCFRNGVAFNPVTPSAYAGPSNT